MFQSSFQQPRIMYQGGTGKNTMQTSIMPNNAYKQIQYGQNNQAYYPQYMQENTYKGGNKFLKAFSHFPFLPKSMSTNAKGLCGFLTMLLFITLIIVIVGLTPVYLKLTQPDQAANNQLRRFTINLQNGLQLNDPEIALIVAKPEAERTPKEKRDLDSTILELTEQLNEKTKAKLSPDLESISNLKFETNKKDAVDVSFSLVTEPISEIDAKTIRKSLDEKLRTANLYDDILLQSDGSTKLKIGSMSDLMISELESNEQNDQAQNKELQSVKKEKKKHKKKNRHGKDSDDSDSDEHAGHRSESNRRKKKKHSSSESSFSSSEESEKVLNELAEAPILYPRPYETEHKRYSYEKTDYKYEYKNDYKHDDYSNSYENEHYSNSYENNGRYYEDESLRVRILRKRIEHLSEKLYRLKGDLYTCKAPYMKSSPGDDPKNLQKSANDKFQVDKTKLIDGLKKVKKILNDEEKNEQSLQKQAKSNNGNSDQSLKTQLKTQNDYYYDQDTGFLRRLAARLRGRVGRVNGELDDCKKYNKLYKYGYGQKLKESGKSKGEENGKDKSEKISLKGGKDLELFIPFPFTLFPKPTTTEEPTTTAEEPTTTAEEPTTTAEETTTSAEETTTSAEEPTTTEEEPITTEEENTTSAEETNSEILSDQKEIIV